MSMVYYPLTDTWETVPANSKVQPKVEPKVESEGATTAPKPQDPKD